MKKFVNFSYFFLIFSNKLPNYYIFGKNFGGPGPHRPPTDRLWLQALFPGNPEPYKLVHSIEPLGFELFEFLFHYIYSLIFFLSLLFSFCPVLQSLVGYVPGVSRPQLRAPETR